MKTNTNETKRWVPQDELNGAERQLARNVESKGLATFAEVAKAIRGFDEVKITAWIKATKTSQ